MFIQFVHNRAENQMKWRNKNCHLWKMYEDSKIFSVKWIFRNKYDWSYFVIHNSYAINTKLNQIFCKLSWYFVFLHWMCAYHSWSIAMKKLARINWLQITFFTWNPRNLFINTIFTFTVDFFSNQKLDLKMH